MKLGWLILLLLPAQLLSADVFEKLNELQGLSVHQKIYYWTQEFTGLPYGKGGPLGEGKSGRFDQDPLYRFDTFDCTTFVETITALALSSNKIQFEDHLINLRYKDGSVSYENRNHITSHSWIPENTSNGYYSEMTYGFSENLQLTARATIDVPNWFEKHSLSRLRLPDTSRRKKKRRLKELRKLSKQFQVEEVELPYLGINKLLSNWEQFSKELSGVYIINIVRPNWNMKYKIGTNLNISHQGFLLEKNGVPTMIHASTEGKVVQIPLKKYLGWFKNSSTVKGINLLQVNQ